MSQRTLFTALGALALVCGATVALAQAPERSFNLKHAGAADTTSQARKAAQKRLFVPALEPGKFELSVSLGFLGMSGDLLSYPGRMIYKRTNESTYYGDVVLQGKSAFNPVLRLGYGVKPWLFLEGAWGVSVSEYTSRITRTVSISNEQGNNERIEGVPLGPFDAEQRSCITLNSGLNTLIYPFDLRGDATGRLHPFVLGGFGRTWYSLNSNYTKGAASSWTMTGGGGLRYVADDLISVRIEILYNHSRVQFDPQETFLELNEGTLVIPLYELPDVGVPVPVREFEAHDVNAMSWAVGFTAAF